MFHVTVLNSSSYLIIAHHVSMETCLEEFSEEFCFSNQLEEYPNCNLIILILILVIYYRYYGHCPILHYIRGVGEVRNDRLDH